MKTREIRRKAEKIADRRGLKDEVMYGIMGDENNRRYELVNERRRFIRNYIKKYEKIYGKRKSV